MKSKFLIRFCVVAFLFGAACEGSSRAYDVSAESWLQKLEHGDASEIQSALKDFDVWRLANPKVFAKVEAPYSAVFFARVAKVFVNKLAHHWLTLDRPSQTSILSAFREMIDASEAVAAAHPNNRARRDHVSFLEDQQGVFLKSIFAENPNMSVDDLSDLIHSSDLSFESGERGSDAIMLESDYAGPDRRSTAWKFMLRILHAGKPADLSEITRLANVVFRNSVLIRSSFDEQISFREPQQSFLETVGLPRIPRQLKLPKSVYADHFVFDFKRVPQRWPSGATRTEVYVRDHRSRVRNRLGVIVNRSDEPDAIHLQLKNTGFWPARGRWALQQLIISPSRVILAGARQQSEFLRFSGCEELLVN